MVALMEPATYLRLLKVQVILVKPFYLIGHQGIDLQNEPEASALNQLSGI